MHDLSHGSMCAHYQITYWTNGLHVVVYGDCAKLGQIGQELGIPRVARNV